MPITTGNAAMTDEERLVLALHVVARADGGTPGQFLETLEYIMRDRTWEKRGQTLRTMLETPPPHGAGIKADDVLRLIEFTHPHEENNQVKHAALQAMRREVQKELHEPLKEPSDNKSGPGRGHKTSLYYNDVLSDKEQQGTSKSYTLRRLRRDRPDLADRVIAGELSANAAAIEAGFQHKTISVPIEDPAGIARILKAYLTAEQINEVFATLRTLQTKEGQ